MKRFILLALLMAATVSLNVQCTTVEASEKSPGMEAAPRDITERHLKINKSFTSVDVKRGVTVFYTVGNSNSVRIVGSDELVDHTVVTVEHGTLKVYIERELLPRNMNINTLAVYVTAPAFREVSMSSGSCFTLATPMSIADDFTVRGSSGANFKAEHSLKCGTLDLNPSSGCIMDISSLKAKTAHVNASSGAIVTLNGDVTTLTAHISSGANANFTGLNTHEGSVHASSGSIVNIKKGSSLAVKSSSGAIVHRK